MANQTQQINRLDIVATQGAYLVPRPHTPVFDKDYHENFSAALDRKFSSLDVELLLRKTMYGEAADEWPIGHTPSEVKERRRAEVRAMDEMEGATSDEGNDMDEGSDRDEGDDAAPDGKARVNKARPAPELRPHEAHGLPTPPLSAHSPLPTPQGRKRRYEEEEYPRNRVISTARLDVPEGEKPDGSQAKDRKRRRTDDVDDEGEGDRERPVKARKSAQQSLPAYKVDRGLVADRIPREPTQDLRHQGNAVGANSHEERNELVASHHHVADLEGVGGQAAGDQAVRQDDASEVEQLPAWADKVVASGLLAPITAGTTGAHSANHRRSARKKTTSCMSGPEIRNP